MSDTTKTLDELKGNIKRVLELEGDLRTVKSGQAEIRQEIANISVKNAELIDAAKAEALKAQPDRLDEIEADLREKLKTSGGGAAKTAGSQFVNSDRFKTAADRTAIQGVVVERARKDVTISPNANPPNYTGELVRPQDTRLAMRSLIPVGRSERDVIEYVKLTGRADNAAAVAEGALKPESNLVMADASATMVVLAHHIPVTRQQLSDVDGLRSLIDSELEYGLMKVEDDKFLNGPGGAGDIDGIIPQATAFDKATYNARVTNPTLLDEIRGMMAQLQVADYAPDGLVLNPIDWFDIETTKTTEGAYIFANPQGSATPRLWGLPVVATNQIAAADVLVGGFNIGAMIYDGQLEGTYGIEIATGYINDQFVRNQLTVRGEERTTLAVKRPGAFVYHDSDAV